MKIAYDKYLHLIAGFIIGVIGTMITPFPYLGIVLSIIAGLCKELYDEYIYGGFDYKDMAYTCVGGIIGFILMYLVIMI